jgi:indolepyruvate ferredoxin oxidoreductase
MNRFRGLRGTLLDPFRNSAEARLARQVLADYESDIEFALTHAKLAEASKISELLNLPDHIRGYGHVRERHVAEVTQTRQKLRDTITSSASKAA